MSANDDLFDKSYEREVDFKINNSLVSFLAGEIAQRFFPAKEISLLEIGVGALSLLESEKLHFIEERLDYYEGIDFSLAAIQKARQFCARNFIHKNICEYELKNHFNVIIDAHCLHTICDHSAREKYFQAVYNALVDGGVFFLETMIAPKNVGDLIEYKYDSFAKVLMKGERAVIKLEDAFSIEKALLDMGFEIVFFYCPLGLKFIPETGRSEVLVNDPDVLRLIARKKEKQEG